MHQVGGHIILETEEPGHQRIVIPDHHPIRLGTVASILRAAIAEGVAVWRGWLQVGLMV